MRRRSVERCAQIETEARVLARTGLYRDARTIEMALVMRGFREATEMFGNRWTQSELDRLCGEAIRRRQEKMAA